MNSASTPGEWEVTLAADHPVFAGHFPGAPVVPGALLLCLLLEHLPRSPEAALRLGAAPCIEKAKFLAPIDPGRAMRFAFAVQATGVEFTIHVGNICAARGRLTPGATSPAAAFRPTTPVTPIP